MMTAEMKERVSTVSIMNKIFRRANMESYLIHRLSKNHILFI